MKLIISVDSSENRTSVYSRVDILELGSFQELPMTFRAKISVQLWWFDSRLTFANLKKDNERNSIGNLDEQKIRKSFDQFLKAA
jgi:hypothetical protein